MGVCGVHASPALQFLVRGDLTIGKLEAIVTIEALAHWFRSNAQRFLHDQLHGLRASRTIQMVSNVMYTTFCILYR